MGWGDEVLITGYVRELYQSTHKLVTIIDRHSRQRSHEAWLNNPYISPSGKKTSNIIVHCSGHRPYIDQKSDEKWVWKNVRLPLPDLFFNDEELEFGLDKCGYVIIEPTIKDRASPNKQYPIELWSKLIDLLISHKFDLAQVGPPGKKSIDSRVSMIETPNLRLASSVLKNSLAYIGHEGGLHHSAAAVRIPAVVIMGGFISPQQTGYNIPYHSYLTGNSIKPCGSRKICKHCLDAMYSISPQLIIREFLRVLNEKH